MPKVEDICSQLNGAKYFSTLDLQAGYHHIPLDEASIQYTAFTSPFGKYENIKIPFGLTQQKWSTTEQEAYSVYYTVTKLNCYLQGAEIIVYNDHKLLARFLNGKNTNNKVNR